MIACERKLAEYGLPRSSTWSVLKLWPDMAPNVITASLIPRGQRSSISRCHCPPSSPSSLSFSHLPIPKRHTSSLSVPLSTLAHLQPISATSFASCSSHAHFLHTCPPLDSPTICPFPSARSPICPFPSCHPLPHPLHPTQESQPNATTKYLRLACAQNISVLLKHATPMTEHRILTNKNKNRKMIEQANCSGRSLGYRSLPQDQSPKKQNMSSFKKKRGVKKSRPYDFVQPWLIQHWSGQWLRGGFFESQCGSHRVPSGRTAWRFDRD